MSHDESREARFTAYALGELTGEERAAVEAELATDEAARREVEAMKDLGEALRRDLAAQAGPGLSAAGRSRIEDRLAARPAAPAAPRWRIVGLAAAGLLVAGGVGMWVVTKDGVRDEFGDSAMTVDSELDSIGSDAPNNEGRHIRPSGTVLPRFGPSTAGGEITADRLMEKESSLETRRRDLGRANWAGAAPPPAPRPAAGPAPDEGPSTEDYAHTPENAFKVVARDPLSTFSIDVDTASYSNVRRFLQGGSLPPEGAVRIEELLNYFGYDYAQPEGDDPFAAHLEIASCPWATDHRLVRIGLKGKEIDLAKRPVSNLVFLIDVSGSMSQPNKLPLLVSGFKRMVQQLGENDTVSIAVYAGASGLVLPPTSGERKGDILAALDRLRAGGSTNGGAGIELAYRTALENFVEGGVNRVLLATDGDFNVGTTSRDQLVRLVEEKAKSGVFLTVLGFGMGNYKDAMLEQIADKGNGAYAYIDNDREAKKVLVEQMSGTLVTIAKDVKIQVEFNPAKVLAYRLVGYENRMLAAEDFNDDKKDAGEIGAGHTVTALYEIVPAGKDLAVPGVDPLKYQAPRQNTEAADSDEILTLKLRYKDPDGDTSKLLERPVIDAGRSFDEASNDFQFAAAVAQFGMLLRGSAHKGESNYDAVLELAGSGVGKDPGGYRAEFLDLVKKARAVDRR